MFVMQFNLNMFVKSKTSYFQSNVKFLKGKKNQINKQLYNYDDDDNCFKMFNKRPYQFLLLLLHYFNTFPEMSLSKILDTLLEDEPDMFAALDGCEQTLGIDGGILLQTLVGSQNEPAISVWHAMQECAISKGMQLDQITALQKHVRF